LYCISELDGDAIDDYIDDGWSDELMPRDAERCRAVAALM
jgi:hypothetical protein